jgi:tetratricopeptide (TPR) repeat protein
MQAQRWPIGLQDWRAGAVFVQSHGCGAHLIPDRAWDVDNMPNATYDQDEAGADLPRPLFLTACLDGPAGPYAGMVDDHYVRHAAYCRQRNYRFLGLTTAKACGLDDANPYWFKIDLILRYLTEMENGELTMDNEERNAHVVHRPKYSHIFWFDTDAIVVRDDVDLRDALPDYAWLGMTVHPYADGEDVWHPQSGVMYIKCCPEAVAFFERVQGMSGECATEQTAMHRLLTSERQWQRGFVVLPYPWNNTLHDQPHNPIVAAFHGNGAPERRREIMRRYVEAGCKFADIGSKLVDIDAARLEHQRAIADGDVDRGIGILERVTRDWPYEVNALKDLGSAYQLKQDGRGMVRAFGRALALDPYDPQLHILIAQAYDGRGNDAVARYHYDRAIDIDPHCARAYLHRGYFLLTRGWAADGIPLSPSPPPLHVQENINLTTALSLETIGSNCAEEAENWRLGIEGYEWCRCVGVPGMQRPYRTPAPMWDGRPIPGQRLLVWHEQGLGDSLWMARWLPEVKRRSQATVILEAPLVLAALYEGIAGVDVVVPTQPIAGFAARWDEHVSIMSLFRALGVGPSDAQPTHYLVVDEPEYGIREADRMTVGLCWQGSRTHSNDAHRSIPWEMFRRVMDGIDSMDAMDPMDSRRGIEAMGGADGKDSGRGIRFVSLQHGDDTLLPILEGDMAATARRVAACDLVITVDSAVAHLAGAMGKPTWMLIPTDNDWRWFKQVDNSPWYPSMRLFRQVRPGDWPSVIERVSEALSALSKVEVFQCH